MFNNIVASTYLADSGQSSSRDLTPTTTSDSGFASDPARDIDPMEEDKPGPIDVFCSSFIDLNQI